MSRSSSRRKNPYVNPGKAARRLHIHIDDLPHHGQWHKDEIKELSDARPDWLVAARKTFLQYQQEKREREAYEYQQWVDLLPRTPCHCCGEPVPNHPDLDNGGLCQLCDGDRCGHFAPVVGTDLEDDFSVDIEIADELSREPALVQVSAREQHFLVYALKRYESYLEQHGENGKDIAADVKNLRDKFKLANESLWS